MLKETQTSICNKALLLLGEAPINSMDDTSSNAARICKEFFATSLRSVLEEGQWPFATIETPVVRINTDEYTKEQKYVYNIPGDCAIILDLYQRFDRKSAKHHIDWDIRYLPSLRTPVIICNKLSKTSDGKIEANQDEQILMEYISDTQSTYSYSAAFVKCAVAQLAADMAMAITHDMQRAQMMIEYAEQMKAKALRQALNEEKQDKLHWVDQFTASREGRIC